MTIAAVTVNIHADVKFFDFTREFATYRALID